MGKREPKHCPNCGSINIHLQELESPHDWEEWYDVYCRDCEWSGDISPDLPLEKANPDEEEEPKTQEHEAEDKREWIPLEEVLKKHNAKKPPAHKRP